MTTDLESPGFEQDTSVEIISRQTAAELGGIFYLRNLQSTQDYLDAVNELKTRNTVASLDGSRRVVLAPSQTSELLDAPLPGEAALDALYDDPPQLLADLIGEIRKLKDRQQKRHVDNDTINRERRLVDGVTIMSNLFLILRDSAEVENRLGLWE